MSRLFWKHQPTDVALTAYQNEQMPEFTKDLVDMGPWREKLLARPSAFVCSSPSWFSSLKMAAVTDSQSWGGGGVLQRPHDLLPPFVDKDASLRDCDSAVATQPVQEPAGTRS